MRATTTWTTFIALLQQQLVDAGDLVVVGLAVEGRAEERLERPETIAESKPSAAGALVTARKQATPTQPKLYTSCL